MTNIATIAERNLNTQFVDNPNRGFVLGRNEHGHIMQLYWIMGRSEGSQNRVFLADGAKVRTAAADESIVKGDPNLLIYNAIRPYDALTIVTNGDQTDTIFEGFNVKGSVAVSDAFSSALEGRYCEPDAPIFTPRISGVQGTLYKVYLSVLKAEPFVKEVWQNKGEDSGYDKNKFPTVRNTFEVALQPGYGACLTTYMPDSQELPSFEGEPLIMPMQGELEEVMDTFWNKLEPQWRVSLAGRVIDPKLHNARVEIINAKQEIYDTTHQE